MTPLLEVGCPIFLEIQNPCGKVTKRSGLRIKKKPIKSVKLLHKTKKIFGKFRLNKLLIIKVNQVKILSYRLNIFLPPSPEVGCPIFLEIQNPWGIIMERSGLRKKSNKGCKIAVPKYVFFGGNLGLKNH